MINVSARQRRGRIELPTHREGHMKTEAEIGVMVHKPRGSRNHQSLEEARGILSWTFKGSVAVSSTCFHLKSELQN